MSAQRRLPSRVVTWILRAVSSREAADAVVGDLLEESNAHGINRRALSYAARHTAAEAPRALRSAGYVLRDAVRALRAAPAPALFILGILAVGIAAATVTFSVVDTVVFRPLPIDHSEQLVIVGGQDPRGRTSLFLDEYKAIHDHAPGLEALGNARTMTGASVSVNGTLAGSSFTAGGVTDVSDVTFANADYLRVLRLKPVLGTLWTADDERRGDAQVAVIGYELWQSRFGGDSGAVGQTIRVFGKSYRIVGVLPAGAGTPGDGRVIGVWVAALPDRLDDAKHVYRAVWGLARLRPGVTPEQLTTQIQVALAPFAQARPDLYKDWKPQVTRWDELLIGDVRGWLVLILAAVMLVVLIACINAANVLLARSTERARDLAIRASLGASRRHLAWSLLAESLILSVTAGILALLFAMWGVGAAKAFLPRGLFRSASIALDARVFVAALLTAVVTGVLCGVVPAWQASRTSVVNVLKDGGAATATRRGWRRAFLIAEISCVGVLLVVSTLFITSFIRVAMVDLGFDRSNLVAVSTVTDYQGTVGDLKERLAHIPGVAGVAAATSSSLPLIGNAFGGAWGDTPLQPIDRPVPDPAVVAETYRVTPDYFAVAGIPFSDGLTWSSSSAAAVRPMVIDEMAARLLFGERSSIGERLRAPDLKDDVYTIVGVVPHAMAHGPEGWSVPDRPAAYIDLAGTSRPSWVGFLVRTAGPPGGLVPALRASIGGASRPNSSAGSGVQVVDDAFRVLTAKRRFAATLMSLFAGFAMLIGAAGIYAVMASVVAQQTREFGVRVALGATPGDLRRGVLRVAGRDVLIGLLLGLPVAWWVSRGFGTLFFQVKPTDLSVYLIVALTLGAIGLVAAIVPARRAARVDPVISLRAS